MSKQRHKGTAFETLIVDYLRDSGTFPQASRSPLHGAKDTGDTMNTQPFVLEIKNVKQMSLGAWIDEVGREYANALQKGSRYRFSALIHKRRGKGWVGDQFVTMTLSQFTQLARHVMEQRNGQNEHRA